MRLNRIFSVSFSPTGTTHRLVRLLAETIAREGQIPWEDLPYTAPRERKAYAFLPGDLVIVGSPTYAGRLPNKIMPELREKLRGGGALAAAAVTFGGRAYDNALAELVSLLDRGGFHTVAAGAFVSRHAFTDRLQPGRPDLSDQREAAEFAGRIAEKISSLTEIPPSIQVPGDPAGPYYVPKGLDGQPANFLKARPGTDLARCSRCGACARLCPMGAIDPEDPASVPGTCIKCQRCVRRCTRGAKFFDDPAFLSHVAMLERDFQDAKENEVFL